LEHALDLLEHIGAPRFEGYALGALGFLDHEEGRLDDAGRRQTAALDKLGRAADRRFEAISLARLGAVRAESGEPEDARELFRRARAMFADASETWWLPAVDVLQLIAQPSARTSRVEGAADAPGDGAFAAIARRVLASARARASTG
jgi:hypothetical protein